MGQSISMKTTVALFLLSLGAAARANAQSFSTLVTFNSTNGSSPSGALVQGTDGNFYGTTSGGGKDNLGTVFKMTPQGVVTTLHSFIGTDGTGPQAGLVRATDGNFYGTTYSGGANDYGTVFKITSTGTLTTLFSFDINANSAANPSAALIQAADGNFYGTTAQGGGPSGAGTVFKITSAGIFTLLYSWGSTQAFPSGLVQGTDGNFYGTTRATIFKITTTGALTTLHTFITSEGTAMAGLVQGKDGNFYGTTDSTVFKITPAGTLTALYISLGDINGATALLQGADGNFYGSTAGASGMVFQITPSGSLNRLHTFTGSGPSAQASLIETTNGCLYGMTSDIPNLTFGTVFSLCLTPSFSIFGLSPNQATAGGSAFTLTVHGARFGAATTVLWNGLSLSTTFVSTTQVMAAVPASLIASPGSANVDVQVPGNTSNTLAFTIDSLANGQGFTTLANFNGTNGNAASTALVQGTDGNFYGTTSSGGVNNLGTVFKMTPQGALTTLYSFRGADGANPQAGLVQGTDGNFYGTTYGGGITGDGTVFRITPDGSLLSLYSLNLATDSAANPSAALIQAADGNFYGTTAQGGAQAGAGTVFKITSSAIFTLLYNWGSTQAFPSALLQGSDGNLYGTTRSSVFKMTPAGALTNLHSFLSAEGLATAGLVLSSDGNFYGTTTAMIFKITLGGTLTSLSNSIGDINGITGLVQATDGNFYGSTVGGSGMLFQVTPSGTLNTVQTFSGSGPTAQASLSEATDGCLYGTTTGTVFQLCLSPPTTVSSLNPSQASAAGPAFTLTVNGAGFVAASTVSWNGSPLTTTYVSATQLTASVPASLIASQGSATVSVQTGGVAAGTLTFSINQAMPVISSLLPSAANAGGPAFTLDVSGSGFLSNSTVEWNGAPLATTYVSASQLTASVTANLITSAGSSAVTVSNGSGLSSNSITFTVNQPITGNPPHTGVGIYRSSNSLFILNSQFNNMFTPSDTVTTFAGNGLTPQSTDIPVAGDWSGTGTTSIGLYRPSTGTWFLDVNGNGTYDGPLIDRQYQYGGVAGDVPVVGDWTGTGYSKVGIFRSGFLFLLNTSGTGVFSSSDAVFAFGGTTGCTGSLPGVYQIEPTGSCDIPVVGDWNNSGTTKVGIVRGTPGTSQPFLWILDTTGAQRIILSGTGASTVFAFGGIAGDVPVVGDWLDKGKTQIGVFRDGFLWIEDTTANLPALPAPHDTLVAFPYGGVPGDQPIVGRWAP